MVCIWGSLVKFQRGGVVVKTMVCARVRIERGGGGGVAGCHGVAPTQSYLPVCIWDSLLKFQGGWVVLDVVFDVFCTVMQFVCTVCMQAITHSVDNVPSQHAVKLVVVGLGFVEHCCLRLFLGDQLQ